jgi:hypothetical protein
MRTKYIFQKGDLSDGTSAFKKSIFQTIRAMKNIIRIKVVMIDLGDY